MFSQRIEPEGTMNWEIVSNQWRRLGSCAQTRWLRLTDDDLALVKGSREKLLERILSRYAIRREDAEAQLDSWVNWL
jgi:uncharacterized protein YjbJ (UPF0337 family)